MDPDTITWKLTGEARKDVAEDRAALGDEEYRADSQRLREHLCCYFDGEDGCKGKALSVSPMGRTANGGKILKVRWGRPGCGKSGGVRMAIVAYCKERLVIIGRVFLRKEDPDDDDFFDAGSLTDRDAEE